MDADRRHLGQAVVAGGAHGVLLQVEGLQGGAGGHQLHVNIRNKVFPCINLSERRDGEENIWYGDVGVGGDVDGLQLVAVGHLVRQVGHPVVGKIQLCK